MKTFKNFILESGTGAGTLSGAAAQEAGEKRAEELRKKFNTILDRTPGAKTRTKVKKVYVTPKDKKKPEVKSTSQKALPPAKPESKKPKALPPAKPESKKSKQVSTTKPENKNSVNAIKSLVKSSAKTKAISSTPQRKALPPKK